MTVLRTIMALAVTLGLAAGPASAYPGEDALAAGIATGSGHQESEASQPGVLIAAADCSSAASRAARQTGGQVLSVSTQNQGGQTVCVVTVLVPGKGNQRPRKQTVTIKP